MDGLDCVLVETLDANLKRPQLSVKSHCYQPYSAQWKSELKKMIENNDMISAAYFAAAWSELASDLVLKVCENERLRANDILLIGTHGQTIFHKPTPKLFLKQNISVSYQACDISRLAKRTGITTVGNFRAADIAESGQGAPLAPYAHQYLFESTKRRVAVQNIGGIGNATVLNNEEVELAFDTGPGNIWSDLIIQTRSNGKILYDESGDLAREGSVHRDLVEKLLGHPYLKKSPPKSTGKLEFGAPYLDQFPDLLAKLPLEDALATATFASARSIYEGFCDHIQNYDALDEIILCGGGVFNQQLVGHLKDFFNDIPVVSSDQYGIAPNQVEAASFAFFALQFFKREPINSKEITGAQNPTVCGEMALGKKTELIDRFIKEFVI